MAHKPSTAVFLCALLFSSGSALALDPESAQQACDEVRQAAKLAQKRYIETAVPKNPTLTFDNATRKCQEYVARFKIPQVPIFQAYPAVQKIFEEAAVHMLNKQCQGVADEFQRNVDSALASVDNPALRQAGGSVVQGYSRAVPTAAPKQEEPSLIGRVVNLLGGGGR